MADVELGSLIEAIEANFEHVYQLQALRHPFHDEPSSSNPTSPGAPVLPSRLPLKRRLAEYRHTVQSKAKGDAMERFSVGLLAVERFRDLAPSFVVALFEDSFVIEPGDVGPIPYGHPVARDLVWAINRQQLTPGLMEVLVETGGAQFYDGCLVVGLVDYRKQAFGSAQPSTGHARPSTMGLLGVVKNPAMQPEMHKILLKPTYQTLVADIDSTLAPEMALDVEAKLLLATSGPVCLDPSPAVGAALQQLHYDRGKIRSALDKLAQPMRTPAALAEDLYSPRGRSRLALASVIESNRSARRVAEAEPYYGLDVKKDPVRFKEIPPNTPLFGWVQPNQRLWRTIRFETRPTPPDVTFASGILPRKTHYTLHILLNMSQQQFDVVFRHGSAPFTALDGDTRRFSIAAKPAVDVFIERFQQTMLLEGNVCVGDVSNPTVFANLAQPTGNAPLQRSLSRNTMQAQFRQGSGAATGPFVNILPPGHPPLMPPRPK